MANLTITTDTTYKAFRFNFNDVEAGTIPQTIWICPNEISSVRIYSDEAIVEVYCGEYLGTLKYSFESNEEGSIILDSFDSVTPTTIMAVAEVFLSIRATTFT